MSKLITKGSFDFQVGDDLTVEKKNGDANFDAVIELPESTILHEDSLFKIIIDKPVEDTAGDLTINVYDVDETDDSNDRDAKLSTLVVEKIASAGTYKSFLVQGLFLNSKARMKLGMSFATDSGAIEVFYKIYKL